MAVDHPAERTRRRSWMRIGDVHPGSFALVMATGIVSLAAQRHGWSAFAWILLVLNCVIYATVWLMTIARVAQHFSWRRLAEHCRVPGVFTVVAATGMVGSQLVDLIGYYPIDIAFFLFAGLLWLGLIYGFFALVILGGSKAAIDRGIDGLWLLAVVATQAVAHAGVTAVMGRSDALPHAVLFVSLMLWLIGGMLYVVIIALIVYRLTFFGVTAEDLTAPYWINMGALAISALTGSALVFDAPGWSLFVGLRPFLEGLTLLLWAFGTWWIPLLLIMGFWRHVLQRYPLRYDAQYWAMVFPLGMYSAATYDLSRWSGVGTLSDLSLAFLVLALVAWVITFGAMVTGAFAQSAHARVEWHHRAGHNA